jgi:hypothetical protein
MTFKQNEHHDMYKYNQMAPSILPELDRIKEVLFTIINLETVFSYFV